MPQHVCFVVVSKLIIVVVFRLNIMGPYFQILDWCGQLCNVMQRRVTSGSVVQRLGFGFVDWE